METVLITLESTLFTVDLEVPADVPLVELLPVLLDVCGNTAAPGTGTTQWSLSASPQSQPFPPHNTLAQCGVHDGAVLSLRDANASARSVPQRAPLVLLRDQPGEPGTEPAVEHYPGGIAVRWRRDGLQDD
jgi:type VII secretion system (Wss) protein YukD